MLPKPLPFVPKPLPEKPSEVNSSVTDSVVVNQADSLASGQLKADVDSLKASAAAQRDSLGVSQLKENVDSLKSEAVDKI